MKNKIGYLLNALYFSSWKNWTRTTVGWSNTFYRVLRAPFRILFKNGNLMRNKVKSIRDINDYKNGAFINLFQSVFIDYYCCYILPIFLCIASVLINLTGSFPFAIIGGAICFEICYFPLSRLVFKHSRYKKYFKIFEHKNESWHRKWELIAIVFEISAIPMLILGFFGMIYIGKLLRQ